MEWGRRYFPRMTSPAKPEKHDAEFDLGAFLAKNQRAVTYAAIGVAVVGVGTWFWVASNTRRALNAEQAYVGAERATFSGNPQLAGAELGKVVDRYRNTAPGVRAAILLAKQLYTLEKPTDGVTTLRTAVGQGASKPYRPAIHALIAAGLEVQSKFDSAATEFAAAAAEARTQGDREQYQASQARSLTSAGKKAAALALWRSIAARETSPYATEAKLRIAELTATPAKAG